MKLKSVLSKMSRSVSLMAIFSLMFQFLLLPAAPVMAATDCINPPSSCPTITVTGAPATVISDSPTVTDFTYNLNNTSSNSYSGLRWNILISDAQSSELKAFNYVEGSTVTAISPTEQGNSLTGYYLQTLGLTIASNSSLPAGGNLAVHFQISFKNLSPTVPESHTITLFPQSNESGAMSAFRNTDAVFTVSNPVTTYNANFNVDGAITTVPTAAGAVIAVPANPSKTGYTFTGWSPAVPATMPAADQTFVAQWSVNQYNANFNVDGVITVVPTNYGAAIVPPVSPTKPGYNFAGWLPTVPATMPASNQTFVAQWSPINYTITFNSDGGSAVTSINQEYGTAVTSPATPVRDGYTFTGWVPTVPIYMPGYDLSIVAQWSQNGAGGAPTPDSQSGSSVGFSGTSNGNTSDANTGVDKGVKSAKAVSLNVEKKDDPKTDSKSIPAFGIAILLLLLLFGLYLIYQQKPEWFAWMMFWKKK